METGSSGTRSTVVRFVDTNVLLYALSTDPAELLKAEQANSILRARDLALSVQVLQEFYVQATRETRKDRLPPELALGLMRSFLRFPVQETTPLLVLNAVETAMRYGLCYWDAAIVEAARLSRCDVLLSEDLSDGADYGGVRVENPFRAP